MSEDPQEPIVAPGDFFGSRQHLRSLAQGYGLKLSSGSRTPAQNAAVGGAKGSLHLAGEADDFAGPPDKMRDFATEVRKNYGDKLRELYHDPAGIGYKDGSDIGVIGGHSDHVHLGYLSNTRKVPNISQAQEAPLISPQDFFKSPALPPSDSLPGDEEPVKLGVTQRADIPVAPDLGQLSGATDTLNSTRAGRFKGNSFSMANSVYLGDLGEKIQSGKILPGELAGELNRRVIASLADEDGLTPEQAAQYARGYDEKQIAEHLEDIKRDLRDPSMRGHVSYQLPPDAALQLEQLRKLRKYESLPDSEKADMAYAIAARRPLTPAERKALGYEGGLSNYAQTAATGMAESLSETAAGLGRATHIKPLQQFGEQGQEAARARLNIIKPEGVMGDVAQMGGKVLTDVAGAELVPGGKAAKSLYFAGLGGAQSLGRGETPEQALESAGVNALMLEAGRPLAPIAGEVGEGLLTRGAKAGTRAILGGGFGYGMAKAEGATDEDAAAQALTFGAMNLAGGKRAPDETASPITQPLPDMERRFLEKALDIYEQLSASAREKLQDELAKKLSQIKSLPTARQKAVGERVQRAFATQ